MRQPLAFFALGAVGLLLGCTVYANGPDVWPRYEEYKQELSRPSAERQHARFVSQRIKAEVAAEASPEEKRKLWAQVEVPLWLSAVVSRHQAAASNGRVCLTLNGRLSDGVGWGTASLEYVQEQGAFVINEVHYQYVGSPAAFPDKARCPADVALAFPQ